MKTQSTDSAAVEGNRPPCRRAGFTLIEILVVVSIIGIVLSIAVISLGVLGDDRELREEARRLAALPRKLWVSKPVLHP